MLELIQWNMQLRRGQNSVNTTKKELMIEYDAFVLNTQKVNTRNCEEHEIPRNLGCSFHLGFWVMILVHWSQVPFIALNMYCVSNTQ